MGNRLKKLGRRRPKVGEGLQKEAKVGKSWEGEMCANGCKKDVKANSMQKVEKEVKAKWVQKVAKVKAKSVTVPTPGPTPSPSPYPTTVPTPDPTTGPYPDPIVPTRSISYHSSGSRADTKSASITDYSPDYSSGSRSDYRSIS